MATRRSDSRSTPSWLKRTRGSLSSVGTRTASPIYFYNLESGALGTGAHLSPEQFEKKKGEIKVKVFVCTNHDHVWPVGVASIVMAKDIEEAQRLLDEALKERGLKAFKESPYTLEEVSIEEPKAIILNDGNY